MVFGTFLARSAKKILLVFKGKVRFLATFRAKREKILGYPEGSQIGTPENFGGSPPEWGGAPGIVFSENFRWLLPRMGGSQIFRICGATPQNGGGALGIVFGPLGVAQGEFLRWLPPISERSTGTPTLTLPA